MSPNRGLREKTVSDADLAALYANPFTLARPAVQTVPFIFASPHSGAFYPASFVAQSRLNLLGLRRSEDAFVDELFASVPTLGAPLLAARFPRVFVDVNRSPAELDAAMFEGGLSLAVDEKSPRVTAGLGVIPRIVRDGAEIYRGKLEPAEAEERLTRLFRPYHKALAQLVEETRARFGVAILIDCHSMPSAAAAPDIVLGDRYGVSVASCVMRTAERAFERRGFSVVRNVPYAGGYSTELHGHPQRQTHALQVEINRALYLDEDLIMRGSRFAALKARLGEALREVVAMDTALLRPPARTGSLAAE